MLLNNGTVFFTEMICGIISEDVLALNGVIAPKIPYPPILNA